MTDLAAFLNWLLPVRLRAEEAIHNGDAEPRPDLSPHADPVTGDLPPVPIGAGSARGDGRDRAVVMSPRPVLVYHRTPALTQERYEDVIRRLTGKPRLESVTDLPFGGVLMHVAAQTNEGLVIFDVFDDDASLGAFREAVKPHRVAAGIQQPALHYPIHTFISAAK